MISEYQPESAMDAQNMLKDLLGDTIQELLEAELDDELGYSKYNYKDKKTTNMIENFNRRLRKVTKSKSIFPSDDALFKSIYLAMVDITQKWTGSNIHWSKILEQHMIYFEGIITWNDVTEQHKKAAKIY